MSHPPEEIPPPENPEKKPTEHSQPESDVENAHGFEGETEASVNSKLVRGTFAVTFFLAVLAVLGLEGITLSDM
jgi:hypothetical protein